MEHNKSQQIHSIKVVWQYMVYDVLLHSAQSYNNIKYSDKFNSLRFKQNAQENKFVPTSETEVTPQPK